MSLSQADLLRRSNEWAESAGLNNVSSSALLSGITIASKAGSGLVRDAFVKGIAVFNAVPFSKFCYQKINKKK